MADAEKAWKLIGSTYEHNPDMVSNTKKAVHVAVGNLCLKAYGTREAALHAQGAPVMPTPDFILQLRQQREVAKAKKQARGARNSQAETSRGHNELNAHTQGPNPDAGIMHARDALESTHLQQSTNANALCPPYSSGANEADPFWFINGFDDPQLGSTFDDTMDVDPDFMLAQDYGAEADNTQSIDWAQWDAWLADSNKIRAQPSVQQRA